MGLTVHFEVLNQLGTPMMYSATLANRPAAGITGRIFFRTDSPYGIFRDTGSAWDQISGASTFSGSLATGQIAFGSALNTIAGNNNLFWDAANNRLGVNNSTPLFSADITGTAKISGLTIISGVSTINTYNAFSSFNVVNDGPASIAVDRFSNNTTSPHFNLRKSRGTTLAPVIIQTNDELGYVGFWGHDGTNFQRNGIILTQAQSVTGTTITPVMRFGVGANAGLSQYYINLHNTGNTIFGPSATVDNGNRLQVVGNITSTGSIFANGTIQSIGDTTNGGGIFYSNGFGVTTATALSISTAVFGGTTNSNYVFINDGNGLSLLTSGTANYLQIRSSRNGGSPQITATGIINFINLTTDNPFSFLTGSSTVTYNAINVNYTINRSGAGIMRGFYYNPTITSLGGSVHNAIETTSGNVLFGTNFFWDNTNGSLGIGTNSIYTPTAFNLDVNGGLLIKNTAGRTAQLTLINANPALGGNNGFLVNTVGGTSGSSYVDFQGYYGTSITGSTALRLNPAGGPVIINSTTNSGEQVQITGTLRVNGQRSGSAGGNSGQHLIINCDGVSYKIALLNP